MLSPDWGWQSTLSHSQDFLGGLQSPWPPSSLARVDEVAGGLPLETESTRKRRKLDGSITSDTPDPCLALWPGPVRRKLDRNGGEGIGGLILCVANPDDGLNIDILCTSSRTLRLEMYQDKMAVVFRMRNDALGFNGRERAVCHTELWQSRCGNTNYIPNAGSTPTNIDLQRAPITPYLYNLHIFRLNF